MITRNLLKPLVESESESNVIALIVGRSLEIDLCPRSPGLVAVVGDGFISARLANPPLSLQRIRSGVGSGRGIESILTAELSLIFG